MIPLSAVTSWHSVIGPQAVNHINQFTSVTIFFNLKPGYSIGPATQFVERTAKQILPPGVDGALQGEALIFQNTVSDLAILMLVAVFVMYVILAILYESYLHPLTVLSSLPVGLLGGLLTLWLFGEEASLYAYIGMFMLMGIVKKNGIMIVDFAEARVRQGIPDDKAIHDASMERFRPIMMTTAAALLVALPIAMGYGADGSSRQPLGLVVVGGLIVSEFITLYVTPRSIFAAGIPGKGMDRIPFFRSEEAIAGAAFRYGPGAKWRLIMSYSRQHRFQFLIPLLGVVPLMIGCAVCPNQKRPSIDVPGMYRGTIADMMSIDQAQQQSSVAPAKPIPSPASLGDENGGRCFRIRNSRI